MFHEYLTYTGHQSLCLYQTLEEAVRVKFITIHAMLGSMQYRIIDAET